MKDFLIFCRKCSQKKYTTRVKTVDCIMCCATFRDPLPWSELFHNPKSSKDRYFDWSDIIIKQDR